jgi:ankyrin repeat protein
MDQFDAADSGNWEHLCAVLTLGNVDHVSEYGRTALQLATLCGSLQCVRCCLNMGANVNKADRYGCTALHFASAGGADVARALLDAGATVDAKTQHLCTPLYNAIYGNNDDVAQLLIDRGANASTIELDRFVPEIPNWLESFVTFRSNCRRAAIFVIGIHKYHRTNLTGNNDINVMKLIGKHIWSSRMGK